MSSSVLADPLPAARCRLPARRFPLREQRLPVGQPGAQRVGCTAVEGHEPLLPPLPHHANHPTAEIHVLEVERHEFAQAEARRVEQLEDGTIAAAERAAHVGGFEQADHLVDFQVPRDLLLALRRDDQQARIRFDQPFPLQVAQERAHGGQFPRRTRPGFSAAEELREKAADHRSRDVGRLQFGPRPLKLGRDIRRELRQISVVRAHRVRRRVAVQPQVGEEGAEKVFHSMRTVVTSGQWAVGSRSRVTH